ncbi:Lipase 1 [Eumeta japonica]|uniref:Lipase 1 n=1 Tax=Eumeta variegata TaxID=151549 RepID=A0A4C1WH46_EUMVA|nr:Lipase 1 [Eumeta japonica]
MTKTAKTISARSFLDRRVRASIENNIYRGARQSPTAVVMDRRTRRAALLAALLATVCCDAQLADLLGLGNVARDLTGALADHPLVKASSSITGDIVSSVSDVFSVPILQIARALGVDGSIPVLLDDNLVAHGDFISAEYMGGLGNEDVNLPLSGLIVKYGFPLERYQVHTADGYILSVFRIPRATPAPVVFLMHGLLASADDWVLTGRSSALAYRLADAGYDVWLGNARGNKHSRKHETLSPETASFWDFSWHEIGVHDLPAMIDLALNVSGARALKYVGHSQGTTAFFVMASLRPEYNDKVSLMVALSPVAWMTRTVSPPVRLLAPGQKWLHTFFAAFGLHEFLPDNGIMRVLRTLMCGTNTLAELLCGNALFLVAGFNLDQLNVTNLPVVFGHEPSGASTKQLVHYAQGVLSREFCQFDYGQQENLRRYGRAQPPAYPIERVSTPVSLVYSTADWLAHPDDVDELYARLGNVVDIHRVPHDKFNHLDFILAKDVNVLINDRLINFFSHF